MQGISKAERARQADLSHYMDFSQSRPVHIDSRSKVFSNPESLLESQQKISEAMIRNTLDTEKYPSSKDSLRDLMSELQASNDGERYTLFGPSDNPHSFWGINRSSDQSVSSMSPQYLQMKHRQEQIQLQQNAHSRIGLEDELKDKQARELQIRLERPEYMTGGGCGARLSQRSGAFDEQAGIPKTSIKSINAQGHWDDHNPNIYSKPNKYQAMKQMSPEMLNKFYGKPNDTPILIPESTQGDKYENIFERTSCKEYEQRKVDSVSTLRKQISDKYKEIMKEKTVLGHYDQKTTGAPLE